MYYLPNDLNKALEDMEFALGESNNSQQKRIIIQYKFEGLKFNNIGIKLYNFASKDKKVYLTYSDIGSVALAQRDFSDIKKNIFTFKSFNESIHINETDSVLISMLPQPYDFEYFEPMSENFKGIHISLNPKFEDPNIGIGSVIRERRKNFVNTWINVYFIQPLEKGALMRIYPQNWALFKLVNEKYHFVKDFEQKPDNETIFVNL